MASTSSFDWYLAGVLASASLNLWAQWVPCSLWGTLTVLFFLANIKALPFMWHMRLFSVFANHFIIRKSRIVSTDCHGASLLFEPIITTTSSPLLEIDFNLHKSNATFFTDLDINRIHLLATLFKPVLDPSIKTGPTKDGKLGGLTCALGGVSMTFQREIRSYERYQIWTKVLCWDKKWLYVVSHFVCPHLRKDTEKYPPTFFTKDQKTTPREDDGVGTINSDKDVIYTTKHKRIIYGSAISKYVFKQGRKTILAEDVLKELKFIPERETMGWDWVRIRKQNQNGLKFGSLLAGLGNLHNTFDDDEGSEFGNYGAFPW